METSAWLAYVVIIILSYLAGSVPSGVVLTALFTDKDVRRQGSGNIGATNVARVAGLRLGLLTLALDLLKGGLPVFLAGRFVPGPAEIAMMAAALAAVGGHLFPIYFGCRGGGKGVATAAGAFLAAVPLAFLAAVGVFVLVAGITRRVSAGSLSAAIALPVLVWLFSAQPVFFAGACVISWLVVLRHKDNIVRLAAGTEPVFSSKRQGRP